MTTDRKRGYLYILLAAMLYSTTEVALKALGGAFAPMQVTVERVLLGAAALMPFALNDLKKRDIQLTKADWGYFTLLGFLTVTLHVSLLQMAVLHMDASATSIIYSGNPVFAVALAHFILHEPLKKNHLLAIGVELVGILFILNPAHLEISLRGFLEIITATLLFATYGTLCKLRLPRLGALVITTFNMLIGGLELLFLLLLGEIPAVGALYSGLGLEIFAGIPFFTGFTLKTTLLLCHVGIGCAAIGFLLTAKITEYTSATEASFVYLVKPILATALAVVVYHEHISVNRMVGIAAAVSVIVGKEIGTGNLKGVYNIGRALCFTAFAFGIVLGLAEYTMFVTLMRPFVMPLFSLSAVAERLCSVMLMCYACAIPLHSFSTTMVVGVLRGGGDVNASLVIDNFPLWCGTLPIMCLLGLVLKVPNEVFCLCLMIEYIIKSPIGLYRLHSGKWIHDITRIDE